MSSKRTSPEEIYSLVMECKASGLSDAQWCLEHGIKPSTFYNWVSRLRKRACDIPQSVNHSDNRPVFPQDVVRLEVVQDKTAAPVSCQGENISFPKVDSAPIIIQMRGASISLQNSVDPKLLQMVLAVIGGQIC